MHGRQVTTKRNARGQPGVYAPNVGINPVLADGGKSTAPTSTSIQGAPAMSAEIDINQKFRDMSLHSQLSRQMTPNTG